MAIVLGRRLGFARSCFHVRGQGGAKAAVRAVCRRLMETRFVFRTDVTRYYAGLDHDILLDQLRERITDLRVLDLQYVVSGMQDQIASLVWPDALAVVGAGQSALTRDPASN